MTIKPLPNMELVARQLIWDLLGLTGADRARVGRDELGNLGDRPYYIRVFKLPAGTTDRLGGDAVLDIDVFAPKWLDADSVARTLEAALLGYPHAVEVDAQRVIIDKVYQNVAPGETPWKDPAVSRVTATYVFTLRR